MKMTVTDAKVYAFNAMTFVASMTAIEDTLKMALLIASIGYTIHKWWIMAKKEKQEAE